MSFDEFWPKAVSFLRQKLELSGKGERKGFAVESWRADRGFVGDRFDVVGVEDDRIICLSIHASKKIEIPAADLQQVYDVWDDYIKGETPRIELVEMVPRTTYCIGLMKMLKDGVT